MPAVLSLLRPCTISGAILVCGSLPGTHTVTMHNEHVIHALVADSAFLPSGAFRLLPPLPEAALRNAPTLPARLRI